MEGVGEMATMGNGKRALNDEEAWEPSTVDGLGQELQKEGMEQKQAVNSALLSIEELGKYAIPEQVTDMEWQKASKQVQGGKKKLVSVEGGRSAGVKGQVVEKVLKEHATIIADMTKKKKKKQRN